jgi:hypothetical protein
MRLRIASGVAHLWRLRCTNVWLRGDGRMRQGERSAACEEKHDCSDIGNSFVQYADALVAQVQSHQISEADAMARYAEYKTKVNSDQQRNAAIEGAGAAAAAAASAPKTCTAVGNVVNCYWVALRVPQ